MTYGEMDFRGTLIKPAEEPSLAATFSAAALAACGPVCLMASSSVLRFLPPHAQLFSDLVSLKGCNRKAQQYMPHDRLTLHSWFLIFLPLLAQPLLHLEMLDSWKRTAAETWKIMSQIILLGRFFSSLCGNSAPNPQSSAQQTRLTEGKYG